MNSKGVRKPDCPLHLEVCYPSCHWWRRTSCGFREEAAARKQLSDKKAMEESCRGRAYENTKTG